MLLLNQVVLSLSALAAAVTAIPNPSPAAGKEDLIPGYKIVDLQWTVKPFPDRDEYVNVTGTVEQVIAKVSKINPDFEKQVLAAGAAAADKNLEATAAGKLDKRWGYAGHSCFGQWPLAQSNKVFAGILYLDGVGGQPHMGSGPRVCGRVSCSYDAGIYWCNDHNGPWTLNSFNDIATAAYGIYNACSGNTQTYTSGQLFTNEDWNVVVRGWNDNC